MGVYNNYSIATSVRGPVMLNPHDVHYKIEFIIANGINLNKYPWARTCVDTIAPGFKTTQIGAHST